MEAMSPQQETLGGQPGRSSSLTGESRIVSDTENKKKMKTLAERRRSAPSLILDKALQKRPSSKESPCSNSDPCAIFATFTGRTLLIDGRVELKRGLQRQERHLFLFNDLFIVAKIKYNNNIKIKNKIKLNDMWTANCVDEVGEGNTNSMKSFVLGWPTVNFVATFSSPEQKDKWLSLLQRHIDLEKEKDHPKNIPLKIFAKDIGNCAYSKTITITNSDTVIEVIAMALPMLGISGSEKDYQLWVNSGREEAPYPLIGHEYPYGIKMSHFRDTSFLIQGSKDCTSPLDLQETFLMEEQLPRETRCQFILKPRYLAGGQPLADPSQKMFKRRRSIINWAFWRGLSTHLDNMLVCTTSPISKQLFGVSLSEICENDNLPKPVLDMLFYINQKGPLTKGVFRKTASIKYCKELKDKLNSGAEVDFDSEPVFVVTTVLKDFLRNVPGSLFLSDLFDQWLCIVDEGNVEEKLKSVQRLLDQLPRANVILLRYLFGMLHSIVKQSAYNRMNTYNLALCIAPSILLPPPTASPDTEGEVSKKLGLLVQFIIENCCSIFGEEITSLLEDISISCNRDSVPDVSGVQQHNSSYDSLENEVHDELGQDSFSMDSLLSSDYDLEKSELDQSKNEIPLKLSLESKSSSISMASHNKISVQDRSKNKSVGTNTTPMVTADAGKNWRRHRSSSEPSIDSMDFKPVTEFYQEKLRKSSCDAVLSHPIEGGRKHRQSSQGKKQKIIIPSSVIPTEMGKKNITDENVKKEDFSHEGTPKKCYLKSKPMTISVASSSNILLQDDFKNQTIDPIDRCAYSPSDTMLGFKSSQKLRRSSEANIDDLGCKLTSFGDVLSKNPSQKSFDAGFPLVDDNYLKRHQSLRVEGQKLINQSLVMGIEVGKSTASKECMEKMFAVTPPPLDICFQSRSSSFSSPGTSPSGTSVDSEDSSFSQISDHSVFIPAETSSPVECTFSTLRKRGEVSSESCDSFPGMFNASPEPISSQPLSIENNNVESLEIHHVNHPSTWLKNGGAMLKNWSLEKDTKISSQEVKKTSSIKEALEEPTCNTDSTEADLFKKREIDSPPNSCTNSAGKILSDDTALMNTQKINMQCTQDSGDLAHSQFSSADELNNITDPEKDMMDDIKSIPGTQSSENPSLSYLITESMLSPAPSAGYPEIVISCSGKLETDL